ncbi:hypothetical protein [Sphingobacterium sp. DR205]|uniref:hypothetical protein n=1 Tax=Sphingobacterium sp. DR205 TaxID=2713573 RepID=UPI0013E4A7C7|nr:hypothetical protein [Sphingobacterium sp. DR205]QIH33470.1 hypothetical protein G6053_11490 [Sphingobacterium sp. DR205]
MEEKAEQILAYLKLKGFEPKDFLKEYRNAVTQFSVGFRKDFGGERMDYRLDFGWDHQFDNYRWKGYRATYNPGQDNESSREFIASDWGIADANLAFHILSGRMEQLQVLILSSGITEFTNTDVYGFLESILSRNPDHFVCRASKNGSEGIIDYEIRVTSDGKEFKATQIDATFTRYPDFKHGIYNGINTAELAAKMDAIDWERDNLYTFDEQGMAHPTPEAMDILDAMELLLWDENGRDLALNLQLHHWINTPFFDAHIHADAWELFHKLPKVAHTFPLDTEARRIYNLLCGRPAMLDGPKQSREYTTWHQFVTHENKTELQPKDGPSKNELRTFLAMLPLDDMHKDHLLSKLLSGDKCLTTLHGLQKTEVEISIDMDTRSLKLTATNGDTIPYNFRLEQQSPPAAQKTFSRTEPKLAHIKKNKKRKGRGI